MKGSMNIITLKIDVTKIDKARLFKGKSGTYLDCALIPTDKSRYGDDYIITQSVSKEARLKGERGQIIGNGRILESRKTEPSEQSPPQTKSHADGSGDDVPF